MSALIRESQRDSVPMPRVAESARLPWVSRFIFPQPQRGCVHPGTPMCHNPVGVDDDFDSRSQGSSCLATLGWMMLPRWGKRAATSDAEKATLQNAVTATDQQIDALVYDLYALTPEEIDLVEANP